MTEQPNREVAVLNAALELRPAERAAYLDQACAGDAALRKQVQALLQAHEQAEGFLEAPLAGLDFKRTGSASAPLTEKPGDRIGRYKLLQQIGEGGCGVVYMAEQDEPVRRRVALKVIKLGMDTKQVIARFEAERQALALMDHPNIAKIYDAGVTEAPRPVSDHPPPAGRGEGQGEGASGYPRPSDGKGAGGEGNATHHSPLATHYGRPYFAMELVRGIKITEFCDANKLSTADRLKLFIQVCQAIQHAHQKGVIHRDIKPSNILVTINDGVPVPKVIDFGIAKATQGRLTDHTLFTAFEQFIGTPAYMSPEQAVMTSLDIDTRSDIYSLGVLLYELLTGRTPFDQKELLAAGLDEMRRTIREVEPVKPSTRLTQELATQGGKGEKEKWGSEAASRLESPPLPSPSASFPPRPAAQSPQDNRTSTHRLIELKHLIPALRGDLDWIVMKALEKDRARRYETANGLATDINRHLNNEPVVARPPSSLYRFQKSVRRNKLAFAAGAGIAAALVIGLAIALWQSIEKTRAYHRAVAAEEKARANEVKAQSESAKSKEVARFLTEMLRGVGPSVALGRDTKMLREILDHTARRLNDLTNQPAVEADLRATLGSIYCDLADYTNALAMHQQALAIAKRLLGNDHPDLATPLNNLAVVLERQGKLSEAEATLREALVMQKRLLGDDHPDLATSYNNLAVVLEGEGKLAEAESMNRDLLAIEKKLLGDEHPDVANSLHNLATTLARQGKLAEAETMHRQALAMEKKLLGDEHPDVADSLHNLATTLALQGKLAEAVSMNRNSLAIDTKVYGQEHPRVADSLDSLAAMLVEQDNLAEAETMQRDALAMQKKLLGNEHPSVATSLNNLATALERQDKLAEAETMQREALAMQTKLLGNEHPDVALSLNNLAFVLQREGKLSEAETMNRDALAMRRKLLGNEHPDVPVSLHNLARVLEREDRLAQAETMNREALAMFRKLLGNENPRVAGSLHNLANLLARQGNLAEARSLAEQAVAMYRRNSDWDHNRQFDAFDVLGMVLADQGNLVEAEAVQSELLATLRRRAPDNPQIAAALGELAVTLIAEKKFADAESIARECLEFRQKHYPDGWSAFSARVLLGESLLGQKQFADAEPLLLSGYEGMMQRKDKIPTGSGTGHVRQPRLKKALELLVQLYEETGRLDQAAQWKQKLAEFEKAEAREKTDTP